MNAPYSKVAEETDSHCYQPSHKMLHLPEGKMVNSHLSIHPSYPIFKSFHDILIHQFIIWPSFEQHAS